MALVVVEACVPVVEILGEIHLLRGPEGGLGLLVHLPDLYDASVASQAASRTDVYLVVLDGEEYKTPLGFDEEGLLA